MASSKNKKKNSLLHPSLFILLVGTFFVYLPSLNNLFLTNWDDHQYVLNNPDIRTISSESINKIFSSYYIGNYQPFTILSYAIDYQLFGLSAKGFHTTNLLLHILNIALVFYCIYFLTSNKTISIIVSFLFAVHPLHVESVVWIAERKDVLYTFFYLLALLFYIQYAKNKQGYRLLFYSFIFFIASCLSKSAGITLPLILLSIDYYNSRPFNKTFFLEKVPFFIMSIIFGVIAIYSQKSAGATDMGPAYSLIDRFFLICYSISFYIIKFLFPFSLSAMYYYPEKTNNLLPWYYYASSLFISAIGCCIYKISVLKKESLFSFLFFLFASILTIQLIPLGRTITADRYTYIPFIGLSFFVGSYYDFFYKKKSYLTYILILFGAICIFQTWQRIPVWKDTLALFDDVVKKDPNHAHGYLVRASAKMEQKNYIDAIADYDKGIKLNPNFDEAYNNRGNASYYLNDIETAILFYEKAIKINPKYSLAYNNLGSCKKSMGDFKSALMYYNKAIECDSVFFVALNNRGLTKYSLKDYTGAIKDYTKTIFIKPDYTEAYANRAVAKYNLKDFIGALSDYDAAIEKNSTNGELFHNRAAVKYYLKDFRGACEDWNKAITLNYKPAIEMQKTYCK